MLNVCFHSDQNTLPALKLVNVATTELALDDTWLDVDGARPPKDILDIIIGMVYAPRDWIDTVGFSEDAYFHESDGARVELANSVSYAERSFALGGFAYEDGCRYEITLALKVKRRAHIGLLEVRSLSEHEAEKKKDGVKVLEDLAKKKEDGVEVYEDRDKKKEDGFEVLEDLAKTKEDGVEVLKSFAKTKEDGKEVIESFAKKQQGGVVVLEGFANKKASPYSKARTVFVGKGGASVKLFIDFTHDQDRERAHAQSSSSARVRASSRSRSNVQRSSSSRAQAYVQPKNTRGAHFEVTYDDGGDTEHRFRDVQPPCVLLVASGIFGGVVSARVKSVKALETV